uniref:Troponin T n=1 Tax=Strigamia maritima TaxID=126957 RepID=T1INX9_STRMM
MEERIEVLKLMDEITEDDVQRVSQTHQSIGETLKCDLEYAVRQNDNLQVRVYRPAAPEPQKSETEIILEEKIQKKTLQDEESWKEYIDQWRKQRNKEEEELRVLKEKQYKRRHERDAEEQVRAEKKRLEDEKRQRENEEKRQRDMEAKKKRLEEAEKKRQAMQQALDLQKSTDIKPNFVIQKRADGGPGANVGNTAMDKLMNVAAARGEMGKTREQLDDDKAISLSFRVKPLEIDGLPVEELKAKAKQLWEQVCQLETEKYDLEERQKRQDYDLKELGERQRQINRNKALKKGLDPESLTGKYPPKLQVASKYERRIDRRSYSDKKGLFDGGLEATYNARSEKEWEDKMMSHAEKKGKLPKWLGEAAGKKGGFEEDTTAHEEYVEEEEEEEE